MFSTFRLSPAVIAPPFRRETYLRGAADRTAVAAAIPITPVLEFCHDHRPTPVAMPDFISTDVSSHSTCPTETWPSRHHNKARSGASVDLRDGYQGAGRADGPDRKSVVRPCCAPRLK